MFERLRKRALGYPGATEDHPWGETAIKVNGKVFVFLGEDDHAALNFGTVASLVGLRQVLLGDLDHRPAELGQRETFSHPAFNRVAAVANQRQKYVGET